mmetsp:Transcript_120060/g.268321  ORF Transcript_120060/g.268321 Transcript_120060/m.268321 type:complete len:296 (-) Transcript_120060:38-925(-)
MQHPELLQDPTAEIAHMVAIGRRGPTGFLALSHKASGEVAEAVALLWWGAPCLTAATGHLTHVPHSALHLGAELLCCTLRRATDLIPLVELACMDGRRSGRTADASRRLAHVICAGRCIAQTCRPCCRPEQGHRQDAAENNSAPQSPRCRCAVEFLRPAHRMGCRPHSLRCGSRNRGYAHSQLHRMHLLLQRHNGDLAGLQSSQVRHALQQFLPVPPNRCRVRCVLWGAGHEPQRLRQRHLGNAVLFQGGTRGILAVRNHGIPLRIHGLKHLCNARIRHPPLNHQGCHGKSQESL